MTTTSRTLTVEREVCLRADRPERWDREGNAASLRQVRAHHTKLDSIARTIPAPHAHSYSFVEHLRSHNKMLNTKALSTLFTANSDARLCKRWYLITPNGTLLAYSQPTDTKDLRTHVVMVAMSWQEHSTFTASSGSDDGDGDLREMKPQHSQLRTLTIETPDSNVLVRQIQPQLLLVLEGGVPPRRRGFEVRQSAEGVDGEPLRRVQQDQSLLEQPDLDSSASSIAESSASSTSRAVMDLHRKKLEAMASAIADDFEQTGFVMPEEGINKFF